MKKNTLFIFYIVLVCLQLSFALVKNTETINTNDIIPEVKHDARWLRYNDEKKEPWAAVGLAWLFPTVGHGYAGDWGRGFPFLLGEAASIGIMISGVQQKKETTDLGGYGSYTTTKTELTSAYYVGLGLFMVLRIWEYFDAYATAEQYNKELRQELKISEKEYAEQK